MDSDLDTLLGLIQHYSPSGSEGEAARWLVNRMSAVGYEQTFLDGAGNPVGIKGNGAKQILLVGHIDTVPGEIAIHIENDHLYGRGTVDAKGPLAAFTDAAAQVEPAADWQIVVIGAVGEETDSPGRATLQDVINRYSPSSASPAAGTGWGWGTWEAPGRSWRLSALRRTLPAARKPPANRRCMPGRKSRIGRKGTTRCANANLKASWSAYEVWPLVRMDSCSGQN